MESRYIGSDDGIRRMGEAQELVVKSTAASTQRIANATDAFYETLMKGQQQLGQMKTQLEVTRAKINSENAGGLVGLANTAVKGLEQYQQIQANEVKAGLAREQAQYERTKDEREWQLKLQEREDKITKEQLEGFQKAQEIDASNELSTLYGETVTSNWSTGTENYRANAAKVIAKYNLSPEGQARLMASVNQNILSEQNRRGERINDEANKVRNFEVERKRETLRFQITKPLEDLRALPASEQGTPIVEQISGIMENFLLSESSLTPLERFQIINPLIAEVNKAYQEKAAGTVATDNKWRALVTWSQKYPALLAKWNVDKNDAEFDRALNALEIETGVDYRGKFPGRLESEKRQTEILQLANTRQQLVDDARQKAGANFSFGNGFGRYLAANAILNPEFESNLRNNTILKDNPEVKLALAFAEEHKRYRKKLGELGIERALTEEQIKRLDLSNANNFISAIRGLGDKRELTQAETVEQAIAISQFQQIQQSANAGDVNSQQIVAIADQIRTGGKTTPQQIQQLQAGLNLQAQGLRSLQTSLIERYRAQVDAVNNEFQSLFQFFGGQPDQRNLLLYSTQDKGKFEQEMQGLQQQLQQIGVPQTNLGVTSNFSSPSAFAASRGIQSYRVAPLTAAFVNRKSRDGGADFITPVAAGLNTPHSFNKGDGSRRLGGAYRAGRDNNSRLHAGIDFPVPYGGRMVSVTSGQVLKVGNNPGGYGGFVDILGDNGYVYRYAHIRPALQQGARVEAGTVVAISDGSGAGDPHLHFEVRMPQSYFNNPRSGSIEGTVDPVAHLRELTQKAGQSVANVQSRTGTGQMIVNNRQPFAKAPAGSFFTSGGTVINGGVAQMPGGKPQNVNAVFGAQRPASRGVIPFTAANSPPVRGDDPMGLAFLAKDPALTRQVHTTAARLGVPAYWIADIMAQESGAGRLATSVHPGSTNQNYGLFGFGSDSGVPNHTRLTPIQQVQAYEQYMIRNGWLRHVSKVGVGNTSIAQFWSISRMGTGWRRQALDGRIDFVMNDSSKSGKRVTYTDELRMLGNHAGREYAVPDGTRSQRNRRNGSVKNNRRSSNTPTNLHLAQIDSDVDFIG